MLWKKSSHLTYIKINYYIWSLENYSKFYSSFPWRRVGTYRGHVHRITILYEYVCRLFCPSRLCGFVSLAVDPIMYSIEMTADRGGRGDDNLIYLVNNEESIGYCCLSLAPARVEDSQQPNCVPRRILKATSFFLQHFAGFFSSSSHTTYKSA